MFNALAVVTTTVVGLMVGVEFAVAVFVNPMLLQLAVGPGQQARALGRPGPRPGHAVLVLRVADPDGRAGRRQLEPGRIGGVA